MEPKNTEVYLNNPESEKVNANFQPYKYEFEKEN